MIFKVLFLLILFTLPIFVEKVSACQCYELPTVYQSFNESDVVFTGKAISSKIIENHKTYVNQSGDKVGYIEKERVFIFEVIKSLKGEVSQKIEINNGRTDNMCEVGFRIGENYLVYAFENGDSLYSGNYCSRNVRLAYSQGQIFYIRELLEGKPEPQIYGFVKKSDSCWENSNSPLDSIKVVLEGDQKKFESTTDKNGLFKFNDIPDGNYVLKPVAPSNYKIYYPLSEYIKILNGNIGKPGFSFKSKFTEFTLGWNNIVEGKVFDGEGKLIKNAAVRLIPVSSPFEKIESDYFLDNLKDGKYDCSSKAPGKYFLVAEIYAPFGTKDKARIFYPQTETPEKATPINLKTTDKLNFDILLPRKYVLREIKGNVTWSDGTVADHAKLALYKTDSHKVREESDEIENHGYDKIFTDEQGNFVLKGFENAEYWLYVEDEFDTIVNGEEKEIVVKAKPIKIKVQKANQPLKIVLTKPEVK